MKKVVSKSQVRRLTKQADIEFLEQTLKHMKASGSGPAVIELMEKTIAIKKVEQ